VSIFRRISQAISRLGGSTAPVPGGGAMATQVGAEEILDVEQQEFPVEEEHEEQEHESE
jgi:hypothetical protein